MKKKLFCDQDGCLADWISQVCKYLDWTKEDYLAKIPSGDIDMVDALGMSRADFYEKMDDGDESYTFWKEIPEYPWTMEMIKWLGENFDVEILTSPARARGCKLGKFAWLTEREIHFKVNFESQKYKLLKDNPGAILVDDLPKNLKLWDEHGGIAVEFPQRWNDGGDMENPWEAVKKVLEKLK